MTETVNKIENCYVPWQLLQSWNCKFCGYCCMLPFVNLSLRDQTIMRLFGSKATMTKTIGSKSYVFLKKNDKGCIFLYNLRNKRFCSIHNSKPTLCRLWPFIICGKPKYGKLDEAVFYYYGTKFYVYVEPHCPGLVWGKPENRLKQTILPEIIDFKFRLKNNRLIHTN